MPINEGQTKFNGAAFLKRVINVDFISFTCADPHNTHDDYLTSELGFCYRVDYLSCAKNALEKFKGVTLITKERLVS